MTKLSEEELDTIQMLNLQGVSDRRIAERMKRGQSSITYARWRMGLRPNFPNWQGDNVDPVKAHKRAKASRIVYDKAHSEERKAYSKAYNKAHSEERKAYNKAHSEERKAYDKAHSEERKAYDKAYRKAHREEKKAYDKAYYKAHREEKKAYRERKKQSGGYHD